jgi:hypothetical protein
MAKLLLNRTLRDRCEFKSEEGQFEAQFVSIFFYLINIPQITLRSNEHRASTAAEQILFGLSAYFFSAGRAASSVHFTASSIRSQWHVFQSE